MFNGDEDVGGSGTPREGEPALGAMHEVVVVQFSYTTSRDC